MKQYTIIGGVNGVGKSSLSGVFKKLVLAWDPDFTKVTPEEAKRLEEAEQNFQNGDTVSHDEINWD